MRPLARRVALVAQEARQSGILLSNAAGNDLAHGCTGLEELCREHPQRFLRLLVGKNGRSKHGAVACARLGKPPLAHWPAAAKERGRWRALAAGIDWHGRRRAQHERAGAGGEGPFSLAHGGRCCGRHCDCHDWQERGNKRLNKQARFVGS